MKALMPKPEKADAADEPEEETSPNSYVEESSFTLGDILDSADVPAADEDTEE